MNKDVVYSSLSDYEFLKLFVSISVLKDEKTFFNNEEIEKNMYRYAKDIKYRLLFNDIYVDRDSRKVDLSDAIDYCYTFGILKKNHDMKSYGKESVFNITKNNAREIISKYNKDEIGTMNELCDEYYHGNKKLNKVLIKK